MKHARAALLVLAGASAALTDCTLDAFCTEGAPGCVDPGCHDGEKSGTETDVDCGGSCGPCDVGRACDVVSDCATHRCVDALCCEAPCGVWASTFGGLGYDAVNAVAVAPDGGVIAAGSFSGIVDFGGGPLASAGGTDAFVARFDAAGKHVWSVRFGSDLADHGGSVAVTADGHPVITIASTSKSLDLGGEVLTGTADENLYVVELDGAGNHVWSRAYAGFLQGAAIAIAPDGDLVVTASFYSVDLGAAGTLASKGGFDVLVLRATPTGEPRWARRYGSKFNDIAAGVAVDHEGAIYLLVRYALSWGFGGPSLPYSAGSFTPGVAKLDATGNHVWSRGFPSDPLQDQLATTLALDDRGGLWLTGQLFGAIDFGRGPVTASIGGSALVVNLDAQTGETRWAKGFGENVAEASSVAPDGQGGVVVSGRYRGDIDFGGGIALTAGLSQLFVARLDAAGAAVWARGQSAVVGLRASSVAASPSGDRIFLAGAHRGTLDVGTGPHVSAGEEDAFVAALLP